MISKGTVNLGKITAFGNPYHGRITNNVLALDNSTTKTWPLVTGKGCTLVAFDGLPAPVRSVEDIGAGIEYKNYALLQDTALYYPVKSGSRPVIGWCYRTASGQVWNLVPEIQYVSPDHYNMVVKGRRRDVITPDTWSTCGTYGFSMAASDPMATTPSFVGVQILPLPSKTGRKALIHMRQDPANFSMTSVFAILEMSVTDGAGGAPPVVIGSMLRSRDQISAGSTTWATTVTDSPVSGTWVDTSFFHNPVYWHSVVTTESGGSHSTNYWRQQVRVIGASYDINENAVVFSFKYKEESISSDVYSGYSDVSIYSALPYASLQSTTVTSPATVTTNTEVKKTVTVYSSSGSSVEMPSSIISSNSKASAPNWAKYPTINFAPNGGTTNGSYSYQHPDSAGTAATTTNTGYPNTCAAFGGKVNVGMFSWQTAGIFVPYSAPSSIDGITIPAGNTMVWAVLHAAGNQTLGPTGPCVPDLSYGVPFVNVHPISGDLAFGLGSGFV